MQNIDDKIIHIFKRKTDSYISGEELSGILGITRTGIWKHIQKLKEAGYAIIALPHLGYKLTGTPDRLIPSELYYNLNTHSIGKKIYSYQTIDSTNDTAEKFALEGALEGTVVIAESQSKGKGRLGRQWISPQGQGIYMSIILRPKIPSSGSAKITLIASIALTLAIRKISSLPCLIKWPNDIIIKNKKLSGILTEMAAQPDAIKFVILGIGVNVNTPKNLLPPGATSIALERGHAINRIELTQEILRELEKYYILLQNKAFDRIIKEWQDLSATLGRRVKVSTLENTCEGQAIGIDEASGNLIVRMDNGFTQTILSGDVKIL